MTTRHNLIIVSALILVALAATTLSAGMDPVSIWAGQLETLGDCTLGNLNDPVGPPAPDIFMANESYAYHVYPPDPCLCSEGGFTPESVSQMIAFDVNQIPVSFQVEAQLLAADYDPGTDCFSPGPIICSGDPIVITITDPGTFVISAPITGCPVLPFNEHYFLGLRYTGDAPGSLPIDDQPQKCTEYVERGNGWEDMFYFPGKTGGGKSIIFGDIVCGTLSVDTESSAWGAIKSLYR